MSTFSKAMSLTKSDLKISLRRSESLLVTVLMPIIVLIAFSFTDGGVDKYLPFIFVQSTMATALLSLGITNGFDRRYRVLVRLGTTPIGKRGIVLSKIIYVFILETFQLLLIGGIGVALRYRPGAAALLAFPFCWLASISFASLALIISSNLKAETNLGVQNLTYLLLLGISSVSFTTTTDNELFKLVKLLPSSALHSLVRYAAELQNFPIAAFISLAIFGILLTLIAIRTFKFDE
jgi:ABC-2 type transport system permease protein